MAWLQSVDVGGSVSDRALRAVRCLAVDPSDRVLEIGCGRGLAASLVCRELIDGKITAIDRSAAMVKIAARRNRACLASGKVALHAVALEQMDLNADWFDKVFAVNVSLFWLPSASRQLDLVRRVLMPGGSLHVFYDLPSAVRASQIADRLATVLVGGGLTTIGISVTPTRCSTSMLCVAARA